MSKKKIKPATPGERMVYGNISKDALDTRRHSPMFIGSRRAAQRADRAIRAAVKEAWDAGKWAGKCFPFQKNHSIQVHLENKYGVKL